MHVQYKADVLFQATWYSLNSQWIYKNVPLKINKEYATYNDSLHIHYFLYSTKKRCLRKNFPEQHTNVCLLDINPLSEDEKPFPNPRHQFG